MYFSAAETAKFGLFYLQIRQRQERLALWRVSYVSPARIRRCPVCVLRRIARRGRASIAAISERTTSRPAPSWLDSNRPAILVRASYPRFFAAFAIAVTRGGLHELR